MVMQRARIIHTDAITSTEIDSSDTSDSAKRLAEFLSIDGYQGIETNKDSFTITYQNTNKEMAGFFDVGDKIKIYFGEGTSAPTVMFINGFIESIKTEYSVDGNFITIDGANETRRMMSTMIPADYDNTNSCYTIATDLLTRLVGVGRDSGDVTAHPNANEFVTVKSDGSAFPTKEYYDVAKTIYEHFVVLSSDEYTEDGSYIFYIDTDGYMHWKPKPNTIENIITEGTTLVIADETNKYPLSITATKKAEDIINFLAIDCGNDDTGEKIWAHAVNYESVVKNGWKYKYIRHNLADQYIKNNAGANTATIRAAVRDLGERWGNDFVSRKGQARWECEIEFRGTNAFSAGEKYKVISESNEWTGEGKLLRCQEVQQSFSAKGWKTTLHLKQDEEDAALE